MRLLAALLAGISAYLAVGYLTGLAPDLRWRVNQEVPGVTDRQLWLTQAGAQLSYRQFLLWSVLLGGAAFFVAIAVERCPVGCTPTGAGHCRTAALVLRAKAAAEAWCGA